MKITTKRILFKITSIILDLYIIFFIWNNWAALGAKILATIGVSLFIIGTLLDMKEGE